MANGNVDVVIVGGGAAGVAAGLHLREAGIDCLVVEARPRLGGRAWTLIDGAGFALDQGCGWLHSADRNAWTEAALALGYIIDKTPPPWSRPSLDRYFPLAEQRDFRAALSAFHERVDTAANAEADVAAAAMLDPDCRWNGLIDAVNTFISGAEADRVSVRDFANYDDTGVNWRVAEGYGATIANYGAALRTMLDCPVHRIDRQGKRLSVETANGALSAEQVIVTLPTTVLAEAERFFVPALPEKTEAARSLPLGLADKLFIALESAEEFESDSRLFGRTDTSATAAYHMRPFGRPMIEAYFGGSHARGLEEAGEGAFFDFAVGELAAWLGSDFARRLKPIHVHRWGADPFARGSYSYAVPGRADSRAVLAAPVDGCLFFAGEACSKHDFSTAHGGWLTGVAAAEQVIAARKGKH
jgi:monoamine oxidase